MSTVTIGAMRDRLTIQRRVVAVDSFGSQVEQWTSVGTVWANVIPLSGRELWSAQQVQADVTHRVTLRYYTGLVPKMRLEMDDGTFLNIASVINLDSVKRFHQCICTQEVH